MSNVPQVEHRPFNLANARFSHDMAETLYKYFGQYSVDGTVTVEVTDNGLWLRNPVGGRQFLGSTEPINLRNIV